MTFLETSALTGENVEDAFVQCAKTILTKVETGISIDPFHLILSETSKFSVT